MQNNKKAAVRTAAPQFFLIRQGLYLYDVRCLISLSSLGNLKGDSLSLIKGFEAFILYSAEVDEDVSSIVACKKAIAFGRIEPLNSSLGCQNCSS